MNKSLLVLFTMLIPFVCLSQNVKKITSQDFKNFAGCWSGTLTYLDYTSGKPFTMPAEIKVDPTSHRSMITFFISYPKEPKANGPDTIFIGNEGTTLNGEKVVSRKMIGKDSLQIITQKSGKDGNDNKAALIRHTYILSKNFYKVSKEVRFEGEQKWVLRNEFRNERKMPCN